MHCDIKEENIMVAGLALGVGKVEVGSEGMSIPFAIHQSIFYLHRIFRFQFSNGLLDFPQKSCS